MSLPEHKIEVVEMREYLRETLAEMDRAGAWLAAKREEFAMRLAALDAAENTKVLKVAADFEARAVAGRAYEEAEDAEKLLSDAHRRFIT